MSSNHRRACSRTSFLPPLLFFQSKSKHQRLKSTFLFTLLSSIFPLLISSSLFLLDLIHKVKVAFVEMMHSHIAPHHWHNLFPADPPRSCSAIRVIEDSIVDASFEFTRAGGGGGPVRGGLAAAENDEVLFGGDGRREKGSVSNVGFEKLECSCRYYLIWVGNS